MADAIHEVLELPSAADLVIIGGGVVGAATAFHAARRGLRPLLLEARPRLCTLTTPASTGAFRLQFDNEEELQLVRESVTLFLNFSEVTQQSHYDLKLQQQGYLWVTTDEDGAQRQSRAVAQLHGWGQTDVEIIRRDDLRRRFPYLGGNVVSARFRAGDGFLDPKALTLGLAAGSGASVATTCRVTGFNLEGDRLTGVRTTRGSVRTEWAVIACGPFSGVIAAMAGVQLPIRAVVRHKLVLPVVPEVPSWAPMTIDEDTGAHWRPALQGAYILFTDPSTPASPPVEDLAPAHEFAFRLMDPDSPVSVARIVPFWERVWRHAGSNWILQAGQYTMSPDHRPLIGGTQVSGLFVNTGYSGHGIMGSPAGSRLLADVLTGRIDSVENPFRLDRPFVQRELDVL